MKRDRDEAGAHLLLNGWSATTYTSMFDDVQGYALWHEAHKSFRANINGSTVVRNSTLPEAAREIVMADIQERVFWRLYYRIMALGLVAMLPGDASFTQDGTTLEDRRDGHINDRGGYDFSI